MINRRILALLLLALCSRVQSQVAPPTWEVGKPVVYSAIQLDKPMTAPDTALAEAAKQGYLQTPVGKGGWGDAGGVVFHDRALPPGRYRATFELGAQPYVWGDLYAQVDVGIGANSRPVQFKTRITAADFPAQGFISKTVEFYVPTGDVRYVSVKPQWAGEAVDMQAEIFRLKSVVLTRLSGPLFIAQARPSKVLVKPGEATTMDVTLTNGLETEQKVTLTLSEEVLFNQTNNLATLEATVGAGETKAVSIPFRAGTQQFGRFYRVEMQQNGNLVDSNGDVAAISEHLWQVALGATSGGILHQTGYYDDAAVEAWAQGARADYSNWMEKHFWAPDDWGDLTPDRDEWLSGQGYRYENLARMKLLNKTAHREGIRAITYGKGTACGPAGFELARRKPDWFVTNRQGVPIGSVPDVWDMDKWDDITFHQENTKLFKSPWYPLMPDLRSEKVLDFGINELVESATIFGWDGVRFDGHFSAGNDALSTHNMQRMKKALLEADPDFAFGYNIGSPLQYLDGVPHETREAATGGGHWMNEGINQWHQQGNGKIYQSWRDFAEEENRSGEIVRRLGGTYHYIYGLQRTPSVQSLYKFAIGTAAGGHPVYGGHTMAGGNENWGRFLTRWSVLVWHPNLRSLKPDELMVKAESNTPVWDWMANELVLDKSRRLVVTHLFNPPANDEIQTKETLTITPISDLKVHLSIPAGEKLNALYWVHPDSLEPVIIPLQNGVATLPALAHWGMLVADLRGNYTPLIPSPPLTVAPSAQEVALGRTQSEVMTQLDPLRPELNTALREDTWFSEAEEVSWSAKQVRRLDEDASAGQAASIDAELEEGTMAGYVFDPVPGLYKITARVKTLNPSPGNRYTFHAFADGELAYIDSPLDHPRLVLTATDFDGQWKEVSLNVRYLGKEYIRIFVYGGVAKPDEVVMLDWTKAELIEPYSDARLLDEMTEKPELVTTSGPASKVLLLQGLHHQLFQADVALKQAIPSADIKAIYQRDEPEKQDITQYGTLVLVDYPLLPMNMRLAIREWVRSGGHLIVFGGQYTLAQANWKDTFLEEVLPASLTTPPDVTKLPEGSTLNLPGEPAIFYAHKVVPRPDANVLMSAGKTPILLQHAFGKGRVTLFAGTVLGEPSKNETPFWQSEDWPKALAEFLK